MARYHELQPDAARVISSLRDSGYDFKTAVADVVDNSIAAGATCVRIAVGFKYGTPDIIVGISDNGSGMNRSELKNALTYGSAKRKDEHSLGKFGLGLKTASTSQCKCLTVVTRKRGRVAKLTLDVDHAEEVGKWEYIEDDPSDLELKYLDLAAKSSNGTAVIWTKCDRLMGRKYKNPGGSTHKNALNRKIEELRFHLALVFQRFLDNSDSRAQNVEMVLNGTPIAPYDPFALDLGLTNETFKGAKEFGPRASPSIVRASACVVPSRDELKTDEEIKRVFPPHISPDAMQGLYIYRENRLIHWGDWCSLYKTEFHSRLCRIEVSFEADFDDGFSVDFQKSKIMLSQDVADWLRETVLPGVRRAGDERYREGTAKIETKQPSISHERSNRSISKMEKSDTERKFQVRSLGPGLREITSKKGRRFIEKVPPQAKARIKANVRLVDSLPGGRLWEAGLFNDAGVPRTYVEINTQHPFYQHAYYASGKNENAIRCLDYLIWSLAQAEYATKDEDSRDNYEDMINEVSRTLRLLTQDLAQDESR